MDSYERSVLYARVSTDAQQKEGTIESQVFELKRQIATAGDVLIKEYIDIDRLRGLARPRAAAPDPRRHHARLWSVRSGGRVMAERIETKEVRQWRAKVAAFNFDVDAVVGTVTALLRRAVELEQERLALGIDDDMAVVEAASAQELMDRATALRALA